MPSNADLNELRRRAQANSQEIRLNFDDLAVVRNELKERPTGFRVVYGCADCGTICVGQKHKCHCCEINKTIVNGVRVNTFARDGRKGHVPLGSVDEVLTRTLPGGPRTR